MKCYVKSIIALLFVAVVFCFTGCSALEQGDLEYEIENGEVIITGYTDSTLITEVTVPDEIEGLPVTKIADFSIFNAESLNVIHIGKNVKEIGEWSMTNNQRLTAFDVDEENAYFCSVDGILFSKDMKTLIYYPPAKDIVFNNFGEAQNTTQYAIPNGIKTIRSKAFYKCYYLDTIVIPDSVITIEEKAFHRASALTALDLPDYLEFIGKDAFAYCEKVETVTIPASIKEIDEYAFFNCSGMKKVTVLADEEDVILQDNWYPTSNGRQIDQCEIVFDKK